MNLDTNVKRDYYEILGVSRTASDQEIKSAYRKLAMQYHPDRNPGNPKAEEQFKECSEAYAVLADAEKRARYDRFGHAGVSSNGGGFDPSTIDIQDIFGDIFSGFGVTKQVQVRRLEECDQCKGSGAAPGKSPITCTTCGGSGQMRYQQGFFTIARPCSTCHGSGQLIVDPCLKCKGQGRVRRERTVTVKVPAGVEDGQHVVLRRGRG